MSNGIKKYITEADVPQSDWLVNDKTSLSYVKNRPFYSGGSITIEILPLTTFEGTDDNGDGVDDTFPMTQTLDLVAGETYVVSWNGTEYQCPAYEINENGITGILLGDTYTFAQFGSVATGEPFMIMYAPQAFEAGGFTGMVAYSDGSTSVTLSISTEGEIIHKLDNKFLDLDWLPTGEEYGKEIANQEFTYSGTLATFDLDIYSLMTVGNEYRIILDGVEYTCTAKIETAASESTIWLGNAYLVNNDLVNTGETFLVMIDNAGNVGVVNTEATSTNGSLVIKELYDTYNKLPNEFLSEEVVLWDELTQGDSSTRTIKEEYLPTSVYDDVYMAINNPTGTGSLSLNRKADTTIGKYSVAIGYNVEASGDYSYAEGYDTEASGMYSHAEGCATASGQASHAEGTGTASGADSHAEGVITTASGQASHAEGYNTEATGNNSHAEGASTTASGKSSHAEGVCTIASGEYQHVQGKYNVDDVDAEGNALNTYAHIVGNGTSTFVRSNAHTLDWSGNAWFAGKVYIGGTSQNDASTLATETYVDTAIANLVDSAPETMNTLAELATAIDENADVVDTLNSAIGSKANASDLTSHTGNTSNPHGVTKAQVGLGDVENKSSATIRGELTKANVTDALGYTPPTTDTTYSAAGSSLGLVKSGGDVTISSGVITVNDDSHNHTIANVDELQTALDGKANSSHNHSASDITSGTLPVAQGGTGATTASGAITSLGLDNTFSNPNLIINGDFQVWQRGNLFANISNQYTADRWLIKNAAGNTDTVEWSVNAPIGEPMKYSLHITEGLTENSYLRYMLEDALVDSTYTLSFWYQSTVDFNSYIYDSESWVHLGKNLASSEWTRVSFTFTAASVSQLSIIHAMSAGDIYITGVKLEVGSIATPFAPRPFIEELVMCQRYYLPLSLNFSGFTGRTNSYTLYVTVDSAASNMRVAPTFGGVSNLYGCDALNLLNAPLDTNSIDTSKIISQGFYTVDIGTGDYFSGYTSINGYYDAIPYLDAEIY